MSPTRVRTPELDQACADAIDLARAAAEEMAGPDQVGAHAGLTADGDRVATHLFACLDPAYAGWRWAVTVARASRAKLVTVSECVLLPGPDSLLAPDWVPWNERVRPGDLGVGDLMPAGADDERLVPTAVLEGDDGILDWDDSEEWESWNERLAAVGLPEATPQSAPTGPAGKRPEAVAGRSRVLSPSGRDLAALRWYSSEHGPATPLARAAPGPCETCGFLIHLAGSLGRVFGVCANEFAPDDGRVVSLDHGCGGHSEAASPGASYGQIAPVIDELGYDLVEGPGMSIDETVFESLDHS
ncbi:MAG TPA: DUF3027 domain-containing protein [Streptosporangiaceae bacterium]